jgi:hypothetical protein
MKTAQQSVINFVEINTALRSNTSSIIKLFFFIFSFFRRFRLQTFDDGSGVNSGGVNDYGAIGAWGDAWVYSVTSTAAGVI